MYNIRIPLGERFRVIEGEARAICNAIDQHDAATFASAVQTATRNYIRYNIDAPARDKLLRPVFWGSYIYCAVRSKALLHELAAAHNAETYIASEETPA